MKKSIFTLVVIALLSMVFTSCDNVATTTETPAADTTAVVVTVDSCAVAAPTAVAQDTVTK
jgi:uncharacterized lipoprotein NlpE involved in copper resistance